MRKFIIIALIVSHILSHELYKEIKIYNVKSFKSIIKIFRIK